MLEKDVLKKESYKVRNANFACMRTYILILLVVLCSCGEKKSEPEASQSEPQRTSIKYAQNFRVTNKGDVKLVEVIYPYQGATSGYNYLLVPRGESIPPHERDTRVVRIPLESIVCTSTSHIPFLDYLNETNKLIGFPTLDYISSQKMRKRIDAGKVAELGVDKGMNIELLASLKPDMVMGYTVSGEYGQFRKLEELGIQVVINAEYLEKHPLGRAEWIKFMALFFNKEEMADSVFSVIEKNYLETKALVSEDTERPTVMSGIVYGDAWFLPGGENYAARIFKDAGYRYLWEDNPSQGFLELSFESVYARAYNADFWMGVGAFENLQQLKDADHRYSSFKPFNTKQVYTYEARKGAKGGSEFMELGYLRPDIILKDLVKIAHPHLLPEYTLYFHKKLE